MSVYKKTLIFLLFVAALGVASFAVLRHYKKSANSQSLSSPSQILSTEAQPASPDTFSFAVIGDSQEFNAGDKKGSLKKAVSNIQNSNPDLVMTLGDLVSSCDGDNSCRNEYDNWKQVMQPILDKTKEVQGNHDRAGKDKADKIWQDEFNLPTNGPADYSELTYSFDFGNSHFIVLDSQKPEDHAIDEIQRKWLEQDLFSNKLENIFVFYHEPAYPVSSKINESLDVKKDDRDALWNIFKKYNVTAVFSGHEHIASRKNIDGIYQFIIGNTDSFNHNLPKSGMAEYSYKGHHYATVTVKGKEVTAKVHKVDGILLDTFVMPRQ